MQTTPEQHLTKFETLQTRTDSSETTTQYDDTLDQVNGTTAEREALSLPTRRKKAKSKAVKREPGDSPLLNLPPDVLAPLLALLPPRTLLQVQLVCKHLRALLRGDTIWREAFLNRFIYLGVTKFATPSPVLGIIRSCIYGSEKGWRREALARENMLERFTASKSSVVIHQPPLWSIHSISLSYPPPSRSAPPTPSLTVGSPSAIKISHRAQYEARRQATNRPPPWVLSAGLESGGCVRSDPLSGKVSKGYWGPARDADIHLRPHIDPQSTPSALHIPARNPSLVLWGLTTGETVHTTVLSRPSSHGGRATSLNVRSAINDAHEGIVKDIWAPDPSPSLPLRWVTAGADGVAKLWELEPGRSPTRSGKRTPGGELGASIHCLWTSLPPTTVFEDRTDAVKRRLSAAPDEIIKARYEPMADVVASVTVDGDLRVFVGVSGPRADIKEARIDVGSQEVDGPVRSLEIDTSSIEPLVISVLIHHQFSTSVQRYDISFASAEPTISRTDFSTPSATSVTAFHLDVQPASPVALPTFGDVSTVSARIGVESETPASPGTPVPVIETVGKAKSLILGDAHGDCSVWLWETNSAPVPVRRWEAGQGRMTACTTAFGLIATACTDGNINLWDPLSSPPTLLRTFAAADLSTANQAAADRDDPSSRHHTVNQIILESDMIAAAVGRRVLGWRAGSSKSRAKKENSTRQGAGRHLGSGTTRGLDYKALHRDVRESHSEIQADNDARRAEAQRDRLHLAEYESLGLDEGEDALAYALMISQEEEERRVSPAFTPLEEDPDDLAEVLEMIRLAEEAELGAGSSGNVG